MSTATIVVTGGALLAGAVYRYAFTGRRSAAKLIDDSKRLHRAKDYGGSLAAATEACELGLKEGPTQHRLALLHLAALFHATRKFDEALDTLDQVEFTAGLVDDERDLVPVLHARAEVLELAEKPLALAAAELSRARDIRGRASGPESMDAGFAAFNLARVIAHQSQESKVVPDALLGARTASTHSAAEVAALIEQAASLVLEAHRVVLAAGDADEAAELVREILDILKIGAADGTDGAVFKGKGGIASAVDGATAQRLRAAYLAAAGEAWTPAPPDIVVVGAGASGVGLGILLTKVFRLKQPRVLLVERGRGVGESFRLWPKEMRFISPSFNQQGWTKSFDLNSVAYGTSPAFTLHAEHPSGEQYANYLAALAEKAKLNVKTGTDVRAVRRAADGEGFEVEVVPVGEDGGEAPTILRPRYVVWAAGEFQYPRVAADYFPGSELCVHNSSVRSWKELAGDDFVVIGGYESGMDAASNLATSGKRCTVVSSTAYWRVTTEDPSMELAPYTAERLRVACATPTPPRLLAPLRVFAVEKEGAGYLVRARWGPPAEHAGGEFRASLDVASVPPGKVGSELTLRTPQPPLLCAGFEGSVALGPVKELFAWGKKKEEGGEEDCDDDCDDGAKEGSGSGGGCADGAPLLTEVDESTLTPGLFLVGPAVRHDTLSFCFVYKFRQRFGVVADAMARGLGLDTAEAVERCREMNMFLDDFECCADGCGESC